MAPLADIVVTARRRDERLQDVPVSVVAFSPATLERSTVLTIADIRTISPGLTFSSEGGKDNTAVTLRGIGQIPSAKPVIGVKGSATTEGGGNSFDFQWTGGKTFVVMANEGDFRHIKRWQVFQLRCGGEKARRVQPPVHAFEFLGIGAACGRAGGSGGRGSGGLVDVGHEEGSSGAL